LKLNIEKAINLVSGKLQNWLEVIVSMLPNVLVAILTMILFVIIARVARLIALKLLKRVSDRPAINNLFATMLKLIVLVVGFMIALNVLHLEQTVTSLLAGAGIIG